MKPYPRDRADQPTPGKDITGMTLDACRLDSRNCPFCIGGEGTATIFNPRYDQRVIFFDASDLSQLPKIVLMRSTAYCICTAGRKLMVNHSQTAKDVYARMPDLYDVLHERYPQWTVDDPSFRETMPHEMPTESLRRVLAARLKAGEAR